MVNSIVAGKRRANSVRTGRPVAMETPKSPRENALHVDEVLLDDRPVEAEGLIDLGHGLGGGPLAEECRGRPAWQVAHPEEEKKRQPEEGWNHQNDSFSDDAKHDCLP